MALERQEATSMATSTLKKLLASRGKLQGSFYFVTDASGKDAIVIATLASKDKKGTRAVNMGRPFRKVLKGARYARGSVTFADGKMVFTVHKGTANKKSMTNGLRKVLGKEKGLSFLKKAVVTKASASKEEQQEDLSSVEAIDETELAAADSALSSEELDSLVEEQGDLSALNSFFTATDEELEALYAEEVQAALAKLNQLQGQKVVDDEARADAWAELAGLMAAGQDNLPQLNADLSPELQQVLQAADALLHGNSSVEQDGESTEDLQQRLLELLQSAEQRYFAAGEPEDVGTWLLRADALHQQGASREGIAMIEKEIEWRLVRAERNAQVSESITEVTDGERVSTGQLLLVWRSAYSAALEQMRYFTTMVLTDSEVTNDPRFEAIKPKIEALHALIPEPDALQDALAAYISAEAEDVETRRDEAIQALQRYESALDIDERLKQIDSTAFGPVAVYKRLADAVSEVRSHLSSI